jgi:hypothetical protein
VSKNFLSSKASDPVPAVDWTIAEAAPLFDTPDADSPELTAKQASTLRHALEIGHMKGGVKASIA